MNFPLTFLFLILLAINLAAQRSSVVAPDIQEQSAAVANADDEGENDSSAINHRLTSDPQPSFYRSPGIRSGAEPDLHRQTSDAKDRIVKGEANAAGDDPVQQSPETGFHWGSAMRQSLFFLGVQHGYAATQPKTQRSLKGPFFKNYFQSVKALKGWEDGGRFFTNYVAHPMQGSMMGFVQVQNDTEGKRLGFGMTREYASSRLKAAAWSAAWSTQFEIGPISQASIGNVGLYGKQTWIDIVITPTAGMAMLVTEDAVDRFLVRKIERKFPRNFWLKIFSRVLLNPTRTAANVLALKTPWHRYTGR